MSSQRLGSIRVSSFDQNPERQLEQVPVDRVFTDKASGTDTKRPDRDRLLAFVREGDRVVVHSRIGWPAIWMICAVSYSSSPRVA